MGEIRDEYSGRRKAKDVVCPETEGIIKTDRLLI